MAARRRRQWPSAARCGEEAAKQAWQYRMHASAAGRRIGMAAWRKWPGEIG